MRFALITPVFDGCIESLELLYADLAAQLYDDWFWVLVGNAFSPKMLGFVQSKRKNGKKDRVAYIVANLRDVKNRFSLVANIGMRRDLCIRNIDADYFIMLNADSKINRTMLRTINQELENTKDDLCIYKIISTNGVVYPLRPFVYKGIDSLNYCVSSKVAKKVGYPNNADFRQLNDWRFFLRVYNECKGHYKFIDEILGEYNANNRYKNVLSIYWGNTLNHRFLKDYLNYCLTENYPWGFLGIVKDIMINRAHIPHRLFSENRTYD